MKISNTVSLVAMGLFMSFGAMSSAAIAEEVPASTFAVPVETIGVTKAKGGFLEEGAMVGGLTLIGRTYIVQENSGIFLTKQKSSMHLDFRFEDASHAPLLKAKCALSHLAKSVLGLPLSEASNNIYGCSFNKVANTDYGLEVLLPKFNSNGISIAGFGTNNIPAEAYRGVVARLLYKGVSYEAKPTAIDEKAYSGRVIKAYEITRDAKVIGKITFEGNAKDKGAMTIPTGEDREAVIFMGLNLLLMPDISQLNATM